MTFEVFVKRYGTACGGNWTAMLMSALRNGMPDIWDSLEPHRNYTFSEVARIIEENLKDVH